MIDKRPAYEPAAELLAPSRYDPDMKRPLATTAGAALVLLRVMAGGLWLGVLAISWPALVAEVEGEAIDAAASDAVLVILVVSGAILLAFEVLLAVLIYRGRNWPRVLVMLYAVISISFAFVAWWAQGQDIQIETTLLTLALDILVLLALSSRDAAAYARRTERH